MDSRSVPYMGQRERMLEDGPRLGMLQIKIVNQGDGEFRLGGNRKPGH